MKLVLATKSQYRIKKMEHTGIDFITYGADIDEQGIERPDNAEELVLFLSKLKAEDVAKKHQDALVIGFDSAGDFEGMIIEKPKSYEEAFQRLKMLSGKKHSYLTGITMINTKTNKIYQKVVSADIEFRDISDEEIKSYLNNCEKFLTIGLGYDPFNHKAMGFIRHLNGDPNDVFGGFPVPTILKIIKQAEKFSS